MGEHLVRGLTLMRPWAWAVVHAGKDVENRTWKPPPALLGHYVAIHAGQRWDRDGAEWMREEFGLSTPDKAEDPAGVIVAVAQLEGVREEAQGSPWFVGPYGWELREVQPIEPLECKGAQGLWEVPPHVLDELRARVREARRPPAPEVRASVRTWAKGSARGDGPQQARGAVLVEQTRLVTCTECGGLYYGPADGRHSAHYRTPVPEGWPSCPHGAAYMVSCTGKPLVPKCCREVER